MSIFFQRWHILTNCVLALTSNYSIKNEYTVQCFEHSLTNECPKHNIVHHVIYSWIKFSIKQSFGLRWRGQTWSMHPRLTVKLKKSQSILIINQNMTYSNIADLMQSSMLFCCTETNNILRAVSSSEDSVFSMRTFTWSWCLPVSVVWRSAYSPTLSGPEYSLVQD